MELKIENLADLNMVLKNYKTYLNINYIYSPIINLILKKFQKKGKKKLSEIELKKYKLYFYNLKFINFEELLEIYIIQLKISLMLFFFKNKNKFYILNFFLILKKSITSLNKSIKVKKFKYFNFLYFEFLKLNNTLSS
uniref:30S ribosomal protein S7 n=1 Tax=Nephromyces sp. ex Molgula occidentalis TaxID=2544991 RepID=A0A5C1H7K0_9APIC|nr:30S ribosomal protein S7 [Nephromyces sp. ex Molgula occidentalis]